MEDQKLLRKAKEDAAGPLGQEMAKFPLRFAKAIFFGIKPSIDEPITMNNGTITFVELEKQKIGITCSHVLEAYRKNNIDEKYIFQIGHLEFDPLERIIDESSELDIVTIDLEGLDVTKSLNGVPIGSEFFVPYYWPPKKINNSDYVAFGGFPGIMRTYPSYNEIIFDSWSNGASQVTSVHDQYLICQFEREYWVESFNYYGYKGRDLGDLGGLSGGPVFIYRELYWELIGIIYEFSQEFDLMYIRPMSLINKNGKILKE